MLERKGRRLLVCARRWKSARTGLEALRALQAAREATDAADALYIGLASLTETARLFASEHRIAIWHASELAHALRGLPKGCGNSLKASTAVGRSGRDRSRRACDVVDRRASAMLVRMSSRPLRRALAWLACLAALQASAADTEKIAVPGLGAPAQILVDPWGVPHLYAASADDVYFVQGFNAARDRLFQIDLWRRRGLGRLASVFGVNFLEQDRAARLFLYRGDMAREWRSYGSGAEAVATRFVAGINAYVDLVGREPSRLPFEFAHFGYAPEKWQPEDVVRIRSHGLTHNLASEFSRAFVACHSDLKSDQVRIRLSPRWADEDPRGPRSLHPAGGDAHLHARHAGPAGRPARSTAQRRSRAT